MKIWAVAEVHYFIWCPVEGVYYNLEWRKWTTTDSFKLRQQNASLTRLMWHGSVSWHGLEEWVALRVYQHQISYTPFNVYTVPWKAW